MSADEPPRLIARLRSAPIRSLNSADYLDVAITQAIELNHPIYDCLYLSLALREETFVVTADKRFASTVRRNSKWSRYVKLLSEI
jgi:predicted nucleic acid-binding protein